MSHFAVLVISDDPSEGMLAKILQPYHEFECTGKDDEYVLDMDITEEMREQYETREVERLVLLDGSTHESHDNVFYRDPTPEEVSILKARGPLGLNRDDGFVAHSQDWGDGKGYRAKVHFTPEGAERIKLKQSEVQSFVDFVNDWNGYESVLDTDVPDLLNKHKHGYVVVNKHGDVLKVIKRTNPNKKWDWYQVGGRWSGQFIPGYDPDADPKNKETCTLCYGTGTRPDMVVEKGCNGCSGTGIKIKWPTQWGDVGNRCQVGNIPWEALRTVAEQNAAKDFDKFWAVVGDRTVPDWDAVREEYGIEKSRDIYNANPVIQDVNKAGFYWFANDKKLVAGDRAVYLKSARDHTLQFFAVVKDGKWYEKGGMGWFGIVTDGKDEDVWDDEFSKLLAGLPDDKWLTVVDCHI